MHACVHVVYRADMYTVLGRLELTLWVRSSALVCVSVCIDVCMLVCVWYTELTCIPYWASRTEFNGHCGSGPRP